MRTVLAVILLALVTSTDAAAQDRSPFALPTSESLDPARFDARPDTTDKTFWVLAAALNAAMIADTRSTFYVLDRCASACREKNPLVAPFVKRGQLVTYAAGEVFDAGVMVVAARMKRSKNTWARRTWWVAPAALIAGQAIAARHNHQLLK